MMRDEAQSSGEDEEAVFLSRRLREAERAAGMPPGMILAKLLRRVVEGEPGALPRWVAASFTFEQETPEERAAIMRALSRQEARWRVEDLVDAEAPERFGWS